MTAVTADVRIGIVSFNTAELLTACLDALPAALGTLRAEVVVVDNASTDGSAAMLDARPDVTVVHQAENVGYARAMNIALGGARTRVVIALNPDTCPGPGTVADLVAKLESESTTALVGPRLLNADETLQYSAYRFPSARLALVTGLVPHRLRRGRLGRRFWLEGAPSHDTPASVDWLVGAVHVIRASALAGAPPYDERWFMYVEDMDLCWRLRTAGWQVRLEAGVVVTHVGNAAGEQRWTRLAREERHLAATYDWYVDARGLTAARLWATCHVVGLLVKQLVLLAHRGAEQAAQRHYLAALTRFHRARILDPARRPSPR